MKNFKFFPNVVDYVHYVQDVLFRSSEVRNDPLYSGLIAFIIDHRTPLFFEMSDYKLERSHFTQSFGLFPLRDEYSVGLHSDMFYLHDFFHLALQLERFPRNLSFDDFCKERIDHEHVISNETEVLTYVRHPEWREKLFPQQTILYDVLKGLGYTHWNVRDLLGLRRGLAASEGNWSVLEQRMDHGSYRQLRKYMDHMPSNLIWAGAWYQEFPKNTSPLHAGWSRGYTIDNYTEVAGHQLRITQERYEEQMLMNVLYWCEMASGAPPTNPSFDRIPFYLRGMEGKMIMPKSAKIYELALEL